MPDLLCEVLKGQVLPVCWLRGGSEVTPSHEDSSCLESVSSCSSRCNCFVGFFPSADLSGSEWMSPHSPAPSADLSGSEGMSPHSSAVNSPSVFHQWGIWQLFIHLLTYWTMNRESQQLHFPLENAQGLVSNRRIYGKINEQFDEISGCVWGESRNRKSLSCCWALNILYPQTGLKSRSPLDAWSFSRTITS